MARLGLNLPDRETCRSRACSESRTQRMPGVVFWVESHLCGALFHDNRDGTRRQRTVEYLARLADGPKQWSFRDPRNLKPGLQRATGQMQPSIRGMATLRPLPSWSVLLLGSTISMPCSLRLRQLQLIALSSDLRNAPAKPSSMSARSRISRTEQPSTETTADKCSILSGATRRCGQPRRRRTPRSVSRTNSDLVGSANARSA
jgi:hypothetical protein